jgi:serine/threonine-protein kinase
VHIGEILGRYRVVETIGRGGMATVYAGIHTVLRHRVAIKVLNPEHVANSRMELRVLNEARAIAAIRHPGIVELFDIGRTPDGRAYVVMELLAGESLATRLEAGPLAIADAVCFGRQIASALAAAHERGIVHRDLKPENVFLVPDPAVPGGERAKVLDFGIAKRTHTDTPMPEITATGVLVGTPQYMSPEQCRGDEDLDGRADVYSLGVVLFQMLTGRCPFDDAPTNEQIMRHMYAQPPSPARVDGDVPAAFVELIARCLAKEPTERIDSMAAVGEALARVAESEPARWDERTVESAPPAAVRARPAIEAPAIALRLDAPAGGAEESGGEPTYGEETIKAPPLAALLVGTRRRRVPWMATGIAAAVAGIAVAIVWTAMPAATSHAEAETETVAEAKAEAEAEAEAVTARPRSERARARSTDAKLATAPDRAVRPSPSSGETKPAEDRPERARPAVERTARERARPRAGERRARKEAPAPRPARAARPERAARAEPRPEPPPPPAPEPTFETVVTPAVF